MSCSARPYTAFAFHSKLYSVQSFRSLRDQSTLPGLHRHQVAFTSLHQHQLAYLHSTRPQFYNDHQKRVAQLEEHYGPKQKWYPRLNLEHKLSIKEFTARHSDIGKAETRDETTSVIGRIKSIRSASSKLVFVTVEQDQHEVQIVLRHANTAPSLPVEDLSSFSSVARKGDTFAFTGLPHRTQRGQLSVLASSAPSLYAPSLHQIPEKVTDQEFLSKQRHVHMLLDPDTRHTLRIRHTVERVIDSYLTTNGFTKVVTPIIQAGAGGAVARPFETRATELSGKQLHLRIAPELWLKRLILGGMDRVFEIGAVFRNEGIDATHNPEFSICEFYAAHATLDELITWTEHLMLELAQATNADVLELSTPFAQLEFLPTIERKLGHSLPDLDSPDATAKLKEILATNNVQIPANPSPSRLLDALASHYIEPDCVGPTFITNHPAALSPLAKHFTCPTTGQRLAARAELFIAGREIANMYEEQNSPFAQKEAFLEQLKQRRIDGDDDGSGQIDHAYVEALEWGLPPTGGWGCGLDRLIMLFSGKKRIADVLSFGTLRNVVSTSSKE